MKAVIAPQCDQLVLVNWHVYKKQIKVSELKESMSA